jgi:hypothetical protein
MGLLGIPLTLLIGPTVAVPAPANLMEAFEQLQVSSDETHSTFQITFQIGRSGPVDLLDYALALNPLLKEWNRVIVIVTLNAFPMVLIDGFITHRELSPGDRPGTSHLSITGEDVSVMMDLQEKTAEHPAQDDTVVALKLIASYAQYGLIPTVIPPPLIDPPLPIERIPVQQATDLEHLRDLARRYGYVFYITPGPAPFSNIAYWGPPVRAGVPQRAITVDMGPDTNATGVSFRKNALSATLMEGQVQDRLTNQVLPVRTFTTLRMPLAAMPAWLFDQPNVRVRQFRDAGLDTMQAFARAQGTTDDSMDCVIAEGELDALRYGGLLRPRGLVGVRGVGYMHDGLWYVKEVRHNISKNRYTQGFTLAREGYGSTVPVVIP